MNYRWARFIILLLGNPHLLECTQRRQDGATNPHRVLPLRWCHHLDLHRGWSKRCQLLCHAFSNSLEHCGTSGKDDVSIEVLADINVAFHDGLERGVMDSTRLLPNEAWLEENFRAAEAFVADSDDVAIWKFISLFLVGALTGCFHFRIKIQGDVRELFLHVPHDLSLCRCCEGVATLGQDLHHVFCQVAACKVQTQDCMGQGITLIDGNSV